MNGRLVVLETHPVQYHAPVYRQVAEDVPVTVVYGSDFSVRGYRDQEFGTQFAWDTDLLSGYDCRFLSRVANGGATHYAEVMGDGLESHIRQCAPAAVMVLGYYSDFDRSAIRAASRLRCPLLFRGETTDHARNRGWLRRALRDARLRWLYGRFARLLYIGKHSHAHYTRLGVSEDRLVFSPYCVSAPSLANESGRETLRSTTRQELCFDDDAVAILYSGKLVPRKGVDLLPSAIRMLPPDLRSRAVLVFVGDGEMRAALERSVAWPPNVSARFVGFRNQTELSRYYYASDLLVLPSREGETWGLVLNEALEHGLPVVAARTVGAVPDLIVPGSTGEIIETLTADGIASAVARAMPLVGRATTRDACHQLVSRYSVRAAADGIIRAFRSLP